MDKNNIIEAMEHMNESKNYIHELDREKIILYLFHYHINFSTLLVEVNNPEAALEQLNKAHELLKEMAPSPGAYSKICSPMG